VLAKAGIRSDPLEPASWLSTVSWIDSDPMDPPRRIICLSRPTQAQALTTVVPSRQGKGRRTTKRDPREGSFDVPACMFPQTGLSLSGGSLDVTGSVLPAIMPGAGKGAHRCGIRIGLASAKKMTILCHSLIIEGCTSC
jgi:hypothetical protein